ncbi:hypothetical protein Pst134EB_016118 [Puccinia striiformis f. sp. tritici]|nr:hypothetical protein Pst134EB_016118 [Puccinia striiformis f. sp. tritici]
MLAEHAEEKHGKGTLQWSGGIPHGIKFPLSAQKSINSEVKFGNFLEDCIGTSGMRISVIEPNPKTAAAKMAALAQKEREAKKKTVGIV